MILVFITIIRTDIISLTRITLKPLRDSQWRTKDGRQGNQAYYWHNPFTGEPRKGDKSHLQAGGTISNIQPRIKNFYSIRGENDNSQPFCQLNHY